MLINSLSEMSMSEGWYRCETCDRSGLILTPANICEECLSAPDNEIKKLKAEIKELEEKLNNEWKPASEAVEGREYDLWAVDYCPYQGCTLGRYRICNCRWDGEDKLWRHLSGAPVDSHEERSITHARLIPTPPTRQEGGKE